jgi:hypothetical protein
MIIASNKDRREAGRKVEERYGGDWREGAVDIVRASIAVDRYDQLHDVIEKLQQSGLQLASRPRNRFQKPTSSGYRDVVLNARLPNGHIMEIQLHLKDVLRAKEEAHSEYRRIKGIDDKITGRGRGGSAEFTSEQLREFEEATRRMKDIYDRAWQTVSEAGPVPASIFDSPPSKSDSARRLKRVLEKRRKKQTPETARVAQENAVFYELDGLPVRWVRPKLPMIEGGAEPYPVDSLVAFAERGTLIDKEGFEDLVEERQNKREGKKAFRERMRHMAAAHPEFRRALKDALSQD